MWDNNLPSHTHQIIHANPCPLFPAIILVLRPSYPAAGNTEFRTNFPTSLQKDPDMISLLDFDLATRYVCPIVEHEGY